MRTSTRCLFSVLLLSSCIVPPPGSPAQKSAASSKPAPKSSGAPPRYYDASWADCSGADGKGGVKLSMGDKKKIAMRPDDFPASKKGDAATKKKADWLVFSSPDKHSLSFEWVWVTTEQEKFWGNTWAGSGLAMNTSWSNLDITGAKYLVMWVKATEGAEDADLKINLNGKEKKTEATSLAQYVEGKKLKTEWTRAVIPLATLPGFSSFDTKGLGTIGFGVSGKYPENKLVGVHVDDMYFTDIDMVTPVENLGYLADGTDVTVVWDKASGEKISGFSVQVDGSEVAKAAVADRRAKLKMTAGSHQLTVLAVGDKETSPPATVEAKIAPGKPLTATIEILAQAKHKISPYFNGTNYMSIEDLKEGGFSTRRWGGNATSKYNWKRDLTSAGSDWFFLNTTAKPEGTPEEKKDYYNFVKEAAESKVEINFTIPMLPWIAKPAPKDGDRLCAYPKSVYPEQNKIGGEGCGDGVKPNGKDKIWDNDPNIAFIPNSPELQKGLVENLHKFFPNTVKFYELDNEPALWISTHRDVFPRGYSSDELVETSVKYASMIKSVDPSAQIIGFASWGQMETAGSNIDYLPSAPNAYKDPTAQKKPGDEWRDVRAHGGDPNLVTYVKGLKKASDAAGKRLLDIVDTHFYPEVYFKKPGGQGVRLSGDLEFDPVLADKQFEALREFWDPAWRPADVGLESWEIGDGNAVHLWDPFHPAIAATKKLIESAYPGTKLAFNEYSSGSESRYHGALLRAALLGIFMQEDLFMSEGWGTPGKGSFTFLAHRLYGNYDGKGGKVKGDFVPTTSSSKDLLTYAARDGAKTYLVIVNKSQKDAINATIKLPKPVTGGQLFTIAESLSKRIYAADKAAMKDVTVRVPAWSAELVVLE